MLIVDGDLGQKLKKFETVERTRDFTNTAAFDEARDAKWVEDKEKSVANPARQEGRKFSSEAFMKKLRTINPDITLSAHPGVYAPQDTPFHKMNKDKACLHLTANGQKIFLFVVEGDYMPEWTVFDTKTVRVPDGNPEGMWKTVDIPWHKTKRGWREVLVMLLHKKLVSLDAVERVFGAGDRPSWKILTGKGAVGSIF